MSEERKILSQNELENISGGRGASASAGGKASAGAKNSASGEQSCECTNCGKTTPHIVYSGGRLVCSVCGTPSWG